MDQLDRQHHWENVYSSRLAHEVSWYQPSPDLSLQLIEKLGVGPDDALIDIGGGSSNLVDHLLARGYSKLSALDISAAALEAAKVRLGRRAEQVLWLTGDITRIQLSGPYRLWHDRAVFHFLTAAADRKAYLSAMRENLPAGSHAIIATFAEDGPERCSNLPVCRYSTGQLASEVGHGFSLTDTYRETHVTPAQGRQNFIYCCFRRI